VVSIFPGLGYMALWSQIRARNSDAVQANWGKQAVSVLLYVAAVPAAFYRPAASLALIAVVAVMWLVPPKRAV
jgi:hypothetical protein